MNNMDDKELSKLSFLADSLCGQPNNYKKFISMLKISKNKSKEFDKILNNIYMMFNKFKPKNKEEIIKMIDKNKTKFRKETYILNFGLDGLKE